MRDTLDLKQLAKEARQRKIRSRITYFFLCIMIIVTTLTMWAGSNTPFRMYIKADNSWRGSKNYPGAAVSINTSTDGTTWLLTSNPVTLNRWTDNQWETYGGDELKDINCVCGMAINEDGVWVASDRGIYQFIGEKWNFYPEAIKSKPLSVAANSLGVYVVDAVGNLSHFNGQEWSINNVRTLLPNLETDANDKYPSVVTGSDESILLRWNGIWNFDGKSWQEITISDANLSRIILIGVAHNRLWTQWTDGIVISNLDGSNWKSFEPKEIGLSSQSRVYQVTEFGDSYLFATDEGLINFDGEHWQKITLPSNQISRIDTVNSDTKGTTWVLIDNSDSVILQLLYAICPLVFCWHFQFH